MTACIRHRALGRPCPAAGANDLTDPCGPLTAEHWPIVLTMAEDASARAADVYDGQIADMRDDVPALASALAACVEQLAAAERQCAELANLAETAEHWRRRAAEERCYMATLRIRDAETCCAADRERDAARAEVETSRRALTLAATENARLRATISALRGRDCRPPAEDDDPRADVAPGWMAGRVAWEPEP